MFQDYVRNNGVNMINSRPVIIRLDEGMYSNQQMYLADCYLLFLLYNPIFTFKNKMTIIKRWFVYS